MSALRNPFKAEPPPDWVPEPTRFTRRVAAELGALGYAWRVSPLPFKLAVVGALVHLIGVDSTVLEMLRLIG